MLSWLSKGKILTFIEIMIFIGIFLRNIPHKSYTNTLANIKNQLNGIIK